MKIFLIMLIAIYSNACFAVGWEEVSKDKIESRGISVELKISKNRGCNEIIVSFPKDLFFEYLGKREFKGVELMHIEKKSKGWQIRSKGSKILLSTFTKGNNVKIKGLCISDKEMKSSYISAYYGGLQGQIPM